MKNRRQMIDDRLYAHFITLSVLRRRRLLDHDQPDSAKPPVAKPYRFKNRFHPRAGQVADPLPLRLAAPRIMP